MKVPVRVQRSRRRGARIPKNTVCVSRPSAWGNPFPVGFGVSAEKARDLFREFFLNDSAPAARWMRQNIGVLRGKNLACWCKEGDPCHADVLLEVANAPDWCPACKAMPLYLGVCVRCGYGSGASDDPKAKP